MSRLGDVEPRVIDDHMLKQAVGEQGPQEEAGQLAKQEGVLFKDVLSLQLDFQSTYPSGAGSGQPRVPAQSVVLLGQEAQEQHQGL